MSSEDVTAIIPTYNRGNLAVRALESARRQSFRPDQIIVVVDGSTDRTMNTLHDYLETLPREARRGIIIRCQDNRGVSAARNHGVRLSNSNFIALLDDDDTWHHEKIARQMEVVRQQGNDHPVICTTDYVAQVPSTGSSEIVECACSMSLSGQIRAGLFPPPSSWLFNRRAFDEAGGFDEDLHAGEDVDFVTKLRRLSTTFRNVDNPLTYYVDTPGKVYRNQQDAAARVLLRHHGWWRSTLTETDYQSIMSWYRDVLPKRKYAEIALRLKMPDTRPEPTNGRLPRTET